MMQCRFGFFLFARYEIHAFGIAATIASTFGGVERLMKIADEVDHKE